MPCPRLIEKASTAITYQDLYAMTRVTQASFLEEYFQDCNTSKSMSHHSLCTLITIREKTKGDILMKPNYCNWPNILTSSMNKKCSDFTTVSNNDELFTYVTLYRLLKYWEHWFCVVGGVQRNKYMTYPTPQDDSAPYWMKTNAIKLTATNWKSF